MNIIGVLIVILVLVALLGGGGYYGGWGYLSANPGYGVGGGLVGLILILVVLRLLGVI